MIDRMTPWKTAALLAILGLIGAAAFFARAADTNKNDRAAGEKDTWKVDRNYPPLVFTSKAYLDCSISSTNEGRQAMRTVLGPGFSFDTPMKPIKESVVKLTPAANTPQTAAQGPGEPGMFYSFNAFPTGAIKADFSGLGAGAITEMKAEIAVDVARFKQPGGPGTTISFNASDIRGDSAYVEFTGLFIRGRDQKRFPFRVLFGNVTDGSGEVTPSGPMPEEHIMSKSVSLGTKHKPATVTTVMYEAEEDVPELK